MSSYPAGVTGREYAIAGPDFEADEEVTCGAEDVTVTRWTTASRQALKNVGAMVESGAATAAVLNALARVLSTLERVDLAVCPFEGEVTIQGYQGEAWWECPLCGTEHTRDLAAEAADARADRLLSEWKDER